MSPDGFIAGPDQSLEDPLGVGGMQLLQWELSKDEADVAARNELLGPMGAFVIGRNMFGPVRGSWSGTGVGGGVMTRHHEHDPIAVSGGLIFYFVTGGFDVALDRASGAAGDRDIRITRVDRAAGTRCRRVR